MIKLLNLFTTALLLLPLTYSTAYAVDYCKDISEVIRDAVKQGQLTNKEATTIIGHCDNETLKDLAP